MADGTAPDLRRGKVGLDPTVHGAGGEPHARLGGDLESHAAVHAAKVHVPRARIGSHHDGAVHGGGIRLERGGDSHAAVHGVGHHAVLQSLAFDRAVHVVQVQLHAARHLNREV